MLTRIPMSQGGNAQSPLRSTQDSEPTISVDVATTSAVGVVKPDGTTITIAPNGTISASPSGGGPTLETNGVANTLQSLLNLIAGANVTLTADGAGGVTIAATVNAPDTGAAINNGGAQSLANSTTTVLSFPTVIRDDGGFTGTPNQLTVPAGKSGWYVITAGVQFGNWASSLKGVNLLVNGVLPFGGGALPRGQNSATTGNDAISVCACVFLAVADVITVSCFQNNGLSQSTAGAFLSATRVN